MTTQSVKLVIAAMLGCALSSHAVTTIFFNASQTTNFVSAGTTSDTISSEGYLFTYTRDKLFTGGYGLTNPIGRYVKVFWPDGLEAQAVTAGPNPSGAKLTVKRQDGQPFDVTSFSFRLLANTGGAGAAIEVMPKLNGEDARQNPFAYDATGYYGQNFSYNSPQLTGYDAYTFSLYVDFALTGFTAVDASVPETCQVESITSLTATNAIVNFAGIAGHAYALQRTTNFVNWLNLCTNVVPANGLVSVQDNFADCGGHAPPSACYRLMAR